jgi:hypothetical protein
MTDRIPVVVAYGLGLNSTAMLVEMHRRGEPAPDLILFADTGSERPETYAYLPIMQAWLASIGWPAIQTVKNASPIAGDASLGDECLRKSVLPSLAYGGHSCSIKWKIVPQDKKCREVFGWNSKTKTWNHGATIRKLIGYDAGPADARRVKHAAGRGEPGYEYRYPLVEWNLDRAGCERVIREAGLPVPRKSSCWFCPAMKLREIEELAQTQPALHARALEIEDRAHARGLRTVKGLGRSFSWRNPPPPVDPSVAALTPGRKAWATRRAREEAARAAAHEVARSA